jgi:hypothetical protein
MKIKDNCGNIKVINYFMLKMRFFYDKEVYDVPEE